MQRKLYYPFCVFSAYTTLDLIWQTRSFLNICMIFFTSSQTIRIFQKSIFLFAFYNQNNLFLIMHRGVGTGGAGGARAPLELGIYRVKFSKICKNLIFRIIWAPLGKNRSVAPVYYYYVYSRVGTQVYKINSFAKIVNAHCKRI